ncbi:hypothetical protein BO82DRAFT_64976 [Aspergillus uvarum CBS 121591]|uniref:Uncharacterized protein n=1 Tax=Aspergillus uvarum CBS 121591 TaxID=1448315 RepID=A0A319CTY5_9EURO|nr:hypothetical protein BO82DRAFT_64976 [Aspergillus uvarum CBS 121591]PYH82283.1 hypothetical protein BO82DRAFT_64976 [Aspergillus uvarum CBS 121591]
MISWVGVQNDVVWLRHFPPPRIPRCPTWAPSLILCVNPLSTRPALKLKPSPPPPEIPTPPFAPLAENRKSFPVLQPRLKATPRPPNLTKTRPGVAPPHMGDGLPCSLGSRSGFVGWEKIVTENTRILSHSQERYQLGCMMIMAMNLLETDNKRTRNNGSNSHR